MEKESHPVRVVIADNSRLYREALEEILRAYGFEVTGVVRNDQGFRALIRAGDLPDIAILNHKTFLEDNLPNARWLLQHFPTVKVVISRLYFEKKTLEEMKALGIAGVIIKTHGDVREIIHTLYAVFNGQTYFPKEAIPLSTH